MQKFRCAYVILLMAIYWMTEAIPLAVTSFLPIVLFPLFGVQDTGKLAAMIVYIYVCLHARINHDQEKLTNYLHKTKTLAYIKLK